MNKSKVVTFRMIPDEKNIFIENCKQLGKSHSDVLRDMVTVFNKNVKLGN